MAQAYHLFGQIITLVFGNVLEESHLFFVFCFLTISSCYVDKVYIQVPALSHKPFPKMPFTQPLIPHWFLLSKLLVLGTKWTCIKTRNRIVNAAWLFACLPSMYKALALLPRTIKTGCMEHVQELTCNSSSGGLTGELEIQSSLATL